MVNPYTLLADGFPHGTIDGERQGCVGSNCPAKPLSCMQTAMRYRTDMRFRTAYQAGARGDELPTDETLRTEVIQSAPPQEVELEFAKLSRVEQDNELARRREAEEPLADIAAWAKMSVGGVQYRLRKRSIDRPSADGGGNAGASQTRSDEGDGSDQAEEQAPASQPTAPVGLADQGPESILELDERGPRVVQLWVVLDKRDKLVMGTTSYAIALEHLAREVAE